MSALQVAGWDIGIGQIILLLLTILLLYVAAKLPELARRMQAGIRVQEPVDGMVLSWWMVWLVVVCAFLILVAIVSADAPDKTRDLTKARQAERERAAASIPIAPPVEVCRRWFDAMKAGRFEEASRFIADDSLRATKAAVIRALRGATLEERARFIKAAGFKSAAEIQLSSPARVFAGWMRSGWRPPGVLQRARQGEITGIRLATRGEGQMLVVEKKTESGTASEEIPCELREREWRVKIELSPEADGVR